jgi:sugar O-acyltransferase (sialic acid O-acetyltransferase NeuD family)
MKEILIFGSEGHARIVLSEIIQIKGYRVIGFVDERTKKGTIIENYKNKKYKVVGNIKGINKLLNKNTFGIIGIGSNFIRKKIAEEINKIYKNFNWATIISKNSTINGNVRIGKGSIIVSASVINTGTKIGEHCLINTSSSIDHNNTFENYSSTGPGVTTGGNVELGQCSHLGIGSTVKHQTSIGDNTIIGAQSMVLKNCNKNSVYYGIPAKKISDREDSSKYL